MARWQLPHPDHPYSNRHRMSHPVAPSRLTPSLHRRRALRVAGSSQGPAASRPPVPGKPQSQPRTATRTAAAAQDVASPKLSEVFTWKEDKRIQTQVLPVCQDTTTIRSLDWDRDRFDIEFGLQVCAISNPTNAGGEQSTPYHHLPLCPAAHRTAPPAACA